MVCLPTPTHCQPKPAAFIAFMGDLDRYGVPAPTKCSNPLTKSAAFNSKQLSKGITRASAPAFILPKQELRKGLLHVVNTGIIPHTTDCTPALVGKQGAVQSRLAPIHPHEHKKALAPTTTALEDALLAKPPLYQLDLLTSVAPQEKETGPAAPHVYAGSLGQVPTQSGGVPRVHSFPSGQVSSRSVLSGAETQSQSQSKGQEGGAAQQVPNLAAGQQAVAIAEDTRQSDQVQTEPIGAYDVLLDTFSLQEFTIYQGVLLDEPMRAYDVLLDTFSLHEFAIQKGVLLDEPMRAYDVLLDTFSLHEFTIHQGVLLDGAPAFQSYKRAFSDVWGVVSALIQMLCTLCRNFVVPKAVVDGKSLAELARNAVQTGDEPQIQECLLLQQPGRRFQAEGGESHAATAIQSAWRGHRARMHLKEGQSATRIQGAWRMHRLRQSLMDKLQQTRMDRDDRFEALQQQLYQQ
eukprot:gene32219-16777_t